MTVFVCIGTIAELIKLAPVIEALREQGGRVVGIATGQNDLTQSDLYALVFPNGVDDWVQRPPRRATPWAFAAWAVACAVAMPALFRRTFCREGVRRPRLIVHGDTVSTLIGAVAGWFAGAEIVHVEAGLRSFNLLRPFPEEFCRVGVSKVATWAFCPGEWAVQNLRSTRIPHIVNTHENTLVEAMQMALARPPTAEIRDCQPRNYFLFSCHRQENLFDTRFLRALINRIEVAAEHLPCIAIIHAPAAVALRDRGLLARLYDNPAVVPLPRQSYINFTHLLAHAEFIVTDGGSNQEESSYLGKACLLLRRETERKEGLGENVVLSEKDPLAIDAFFENPGQYSRPPRALGQRPSLIISTKLLDKPYRREDLHELPQQS